MKSVKCIHCGLINWADVEACKRCGNAPQAPAQAEPGGWSPGAGYAHEAGYTQGGGYAPAGGFGAGAGYAPYGGAKKKVGLAVASLVLGLLSMPTLGLLFVGALAGIIMGVVALTRANRQPDVYGGRGLAIGGIVTSVLSIPIAAMIGIVAAIAIPNLLASRRAANEASAIYGVRELLAAEDQYSMTAGEGEYATLEELARDGLIEGSLAGGAKNGYRFVLTVSGETCTISAVPQQYGSSGARSFFAACGDTDVHAADKGGAPATATDPTLSTATRRGGSLLQE